MEKILNIKEVFDHDGMDGYEITTSKQSIMLLIANYQSCCENWGYFMSEDNFSSFIDEDLLDITLTDKALNTTKYDVEIEYGLDSGEVIFVDLHTGKGVLQFTAYNAHNGYYGHSVEIKSNQLTYDDYL